MLIAIEGIDGAGKGTQAQRLQTQLQHHGVSTGLIRFPRYGETLLGHAIGEYLNGRFGRLDDVHPLLASLLFAGDRFESQGLLGAACAENDVVILDRYVGSNIAHQGARVPPEERDGLIDFIRRLEFDVYGLPVADLTVLLDLPVETATQLVHRKAPRNYTDRSADLHEADTGYLNAVRDVYLQLAQEEATWHVVQVADGNGIRPVDDIGDDITHIVHSHLPDKMHPS